MLMHLASYLFFGRRAQQGEGSIPAKLCG